MPQRQPLVSMLKGVSLLLLGTILYVTPAKADLFGFECISNNSGQCPALAPQLIVEVTPLPPSQVFFTFYNLLGPIPSSITDIYFNDNVPLFVPQPAMTFIPLPGVLFSAGASPSNLPGGVPFGFSATHSADSVSPIQPNGANPGEFVDIILTLLGGKTFADTITALNSGTLRLGIHVQAIGTSGLSDALINIPGGGNPVPEPGTVLLLGSGLLALGVLRRKQRK